MKLLYKLVDAGRKLYHAPGSRFHKIWPLFEATETFLLSPGTTAPKTGPHVRDYLDLKRTMWIVIIALLPCLLWSIWNTGYQHFDALEHMAANGKGGAYTVGWLQYVLLGSAYAPDLAQPGAFAIIAFGLQKMVPLIIVSYGVGLGIEVGFAILRKEEVSEGYLVTGLLIPLIVPPSIPLWQLAVAVAFSVVLCKEVFGGTGMNIFNPALMARAFLFFAYPAQMSGDFVWVAGNDRMHVIDGYSGPTALAAAAQSKLEGNHLASEGLTNLVPDAVAAMDRAGHSFADLFVGLVPGSAGETSALCVLIGAVVLVVTGIGSWRTMLSGVIGLVVLSAVMMVFVGDLDGIGGLPPHYHLVAGGFLFGIVFMATDPVSSPETDMGKWIYGFLIGAMTVLVRAVNPAYPEGTMLAILLLNAFAPAIDYFVVQANIRRRRVRLG